MSVVSVTPGGREVVRPAKNEADPAKAASVELQLRIPEARAAEEQSRFNTSVLHSSYTGKGSIINDMA